MVEDDPGLQYFYRETFSDSFEVAVFQTIASIRQALAVMTPSSRIPELIVSDIGLPDGSFLDFLTSHEGARLNFIPVLIVSSIDDPRILRLAFKRGATDYIVKPFSSGEILVKVERFIATGQEIALRSQASRERIQSTNHSLKRHSHELGLDLGSDATAQSENVAGGGGGGGGGGEIGDFPSFDLVVDAVTHSVSFGPQMSQLTQREFQIVTALVRSLPLGLRKENLIAAVWHNVIVSPKNLEVQLARLRKKLAEVDHAIVYAAPYYVIERRATQKVSKGA